MSANLTIPGGVPERAALPEPAGRVRPRPTPAVVARALAVQCRVLNALVLRETKTRYGNYKIGFLWALIEPAVSVSVFVAIFANLRQDSPGGMPLVPFMLVGFCAFAIFKDPWQQMQGAIGQSRQLLTFPQVTTFDVILARGLLEIAVSVFVFWFLLYVAWLLGFEVRVERPLGVLAVIGLMSVFGLGMGFIFASLEPIVPSAKQLSGQVFGRPLYFGSGLFFNAESLPPQALDFLIYNPVLHLIELARSAFFHGFESGVASWFYAASWSFGTFGVGLLVHQAMRRRALMSR